MDPQAPPTLSSRLQASLLGQGDDLRALLAESRLDDLVEATDDLSDDEVVALFDALDDPRAAELLFELGPSLVRTLVERSPRERIAALLDLMPMDDAAEVVSDSEVSVREEILALLERRAPRDAEEVRELLSYPEGSAGRLMTDKFVRLRKGMTASEAIDEVRRVNQEAELVTTLYVVENGGSDLVGVVSIRELINAAPGSKVESLMNTEVVSVRTDTLEEDVARLIAKHDFMAMPVLTPDGKLVGIITVDDAMDVMVEAFNQDIAKMVGTDADEMDRRSPAQVAKLRLPWLLGTMGIELVAGVVIARFDYVLTKVILLASFMPVISAISGNVGLQAAAIVVRGLDTGHVKMSESKRAVRKEFYTTLIMASVCGLLLGSIGAFWSKHPFFGLVIGAAMFASMMTAGFMGTLIPMVSKRLGFDPAATAGPFETAFQDVIGFGVLLYVASLLLPWLQ
jgi:magnesium transporter